MVLGRWCLRGLVGIVMLGGTLLGLALLAAPSRADCGGVEEVSTHHHPRGQFPPLAIGDSTMLLALDDLAGLGYDANAHGCREWDEALALIRDRKAQGRLPHMVVIALGGDGVVTHTDIGQTIGLLCCTRLLVVVTNRELGGGSGSDAVTERQEAAKHPGRIKLLDWVNYSAGHGDWFQPDGLHLTDVGARAFSNFLGRAMKWAYPPKKKRHRHKRTTSTAA